MACLIVMSGPQEGECYRLDEDTTVVGRAETNPVQILDEKVSRKHMKIQFDQEKQQYRVCDMRSMSGVLVNGKKIDREIVLTDGEQIRIGETTLLFMADDFKDGETALWHYRRSGEWGRRTHTD